MNRRSSSRRHGTPGAAAIGRPRTNWTPRETGRTTADESPPKPTKPRIRPPRSSRSSTPMFGSTAWRRGPGAVKALDRHRDAGRSAGAHPQGGPRQAQGATTTTSTSRPTSIAFSTSTSKMLKQEKPDWAKDVCSNPTTQQPPRAGLQRSAIARGASPITALVAKRLAQMFNQRYRLLLSYLAHSFRIAGTSGSTGRIAAPCSCIACSAKCTT